MNNGKKSVWKIILLILEALAEAAVMIPVIKNAFRHEEETVPDPLMLIAAVCLVLWLMISVCSMFWYKQNRKSVILPGLGIKLLVLVFGLSAAAIIKGTIAGAAALWAAGVIALVLTVVLYRKSHREDDEEETEQNDEHAEEISETAEEPAVKPLAHSLARTSLLFDASEVYSKVSAEYCLVNEKNADSLGALDERKIYEYACGPVSFLFAWAVKHGFCSKSIMAESGTELVKSEKITPGAFIRENLESKIYLSDFEEPFRTFAEKYFRLAEGTTSSNMRKSFENDYYSVIRNPWKVYYCIDFTWDLYHKLESRIDENYSYYMIDMEWFAADMFNSSSQSDSVYSDTFSQKLDVCISDGVDEKYAARCLENIKYLPSELEDTLCERLIREFVIPASGLKGAEKYAPDKHWILSELHSGNVMIFPPHGDETAYILGFEADFEKNHGVSVVIRDNEIVELTLRRDASSPWSYENNLRYRTAKALRYIDVKDIDGVGKALRAYSAGTLEQTVVVPEFTGARVPDENRLFLPAPAAEQKNRYDIIAEKMLAEGSADRYVCDPQYKDGSIIPYAVMVCLMKKDKEVFCGNLNVW